MTLDEQVNDLMDKNQALKAWNLVKDTDYPKKDRVYLKVKHAFEPEAYHNFYANDLPEKPVPAHLADNIWNVYPRYTWLLEKLNAQKPLTLLDIGCADGYLCLSAAKLGITCTGLNLHPESVAVARQRALGTNSTFYCEDFRDHEGKYEAVVFFEILEHLPDPKKAIEKCMDLLVDGGSLYISTPRDDHLGIELHLADKNRQSWDDGKPSGHLQLFTESELRELLSSYHVADFHVDSERCVQVEVKHA